MSDDTTTTQASTSARKCRLSDIANWKSDPDPALEAALDRYFSQFAAPARNEEGKRVCINCGGVLDGFMHALGVGVAFQWDLAHGEARCSGCGWPARGMHYVKDDGGDEILTIRDFFLEYHPENVSRGDAK